MSLSQKLAAVARAVPKPVGVRHFHSPFAVLGGAPSTAPVSSTAESKFAYEKQTDYSAEPITEHTGYRTYVVSQPDESFKHYQVPAGAYPTSSPYIHFAAAANGPEPGLNYASTSPSLAHPFTTRAVPQNSSGVGESSAIRYRSAPGEMGARGGSYGGMKLMDKDGTTHGKGQLAERNPPPDSPAAEKFSKAGIDNAWKLRN